MAKNKPKKKRYNDVFLTFLLLSSMVLIEITMLFFNRLFFLNFFGIINDIFIYLTIILLMNFIRSIRGRKIAYTIVFVLFASMFIIDSLYSAFFGGFTSIDSLKTVRNLFIKADVGVTIPLATIIIVIEMLLTVFLIWFVKIRVERKSSFYNKTFAVFLSLIIGVSAINVAVVASNKNLTFDSKIEYYASNAFLYDNFYNSYKYTLTFGYVNYRIRDLFYTDNSDFILDDITNYYEEKEEMPRNLDLTGIFEGYNLVTVLCETLDTRVINETLMPNFTAAMETSLVFDNYYVPTFFEGATINSEYMSLTGRFPVSARAWISSMGDQYKHNDFTDFSLPGQLGDRGYNTYYAHVGYKSFYSRNTLMPNLGFDETFFIDALPYSSNCYDIELIDLMDNVDFDSLFYLSMLTYSMHKGDDDKYSTKNESNPNYENYNFVQENYPDVTKQTQIYFTKAKMFDDFVGMLFQRLKDEGVYDNTIVLFYPDHYSYGNMPIISDLGLDVSSKEIHHQMLTMAMPDLARQQLLAQVEHHPSLKFNNVSTSSLLGATVDLTPTLLNLFTTDAEYKYFSGQDIFAGNNHIFFSDYTVFNGEAFFDIDQNLYSYNDLSVEELLAHKESLIVQLEVYIETIIYQKIMLDIDYFRKIKDV